MWVIPIVDGADSLGLGGHVAGTLFVREDGSVTITGEPGSQVVAVRLPPEVEDFAHAWEEPDAPKPTVEIVPRLERPTPRQLAAAEALFAEPLDDGWVREAEARGRKVHEDALALVDSEGISYEDAIERVLKQ